MQQDRMRKADKKRFFNAVDHIEQAEIPLFEMEADIEVVNKMIGTNYPFNMRSYDLPPDELIKWNLAMGNDMVYLSHIWRVGRSEVTDVAGRIHYVDGNIKTTADFSKLWFPDLKQRQERLETVLEAVEGTGMGLVVGAQNAVFTSTAAVGYQDFCMATIDAPEFLLELQKRFHDYVMRELEMILSYPVDAVRIGAGSGLVTNTGPMLAPDMMEKFCFSRVRQMAEAVKKADKILTCHIDGCVETLMPVLLEMGIQVLNPIDLAGGAQDVYAIKEKWGDRIALHGNIDIDNLLVKGSRKEIYDDVKEHIQRLGKGGGYIVSSSHDLHHLIPVQNIEAMRDAVHEIKFSVDS